jgi:hypothetical protein
MEEQRKMVTDRWLAAIGSATQTVFWAIGYFFGFTLVVALSLGWILPGSFPEIGRPRNHAWRILHVREGKLYLVPEAVALIGWLFLGVLSWLLRHVGSGV